MNALLSKDNLLSVYYHKSMVLALDTRLINQLLSVLAKSSDRKSLLNWVKAD